MIDQAKKWGASTILSFTYPEFNENDLRQAYAVLFRSLAFHITHKGDPNSKYGDRYVNAIPDKIEILVEKDGLFRKLIIRCSDNDQLASLFE
jgi:hypothetical protein